MPQRILILMSMTGGGHRASALALQAGFERAFPGRFQIEIADILVEHTFWPLNRAPQIYAAIATQAPWLWGAAYATERRPGLMRGVMRLAAQLAAREVAAAIERYAPDLVLSVHPLAQELALHTLRRLPRRIPFVTVVTDLASVHPLWLYPEADACFVATEEARAAAQAAGLAPARVHELGLPIRPAFEEPPPPRAELRRALGLDPDLPAVLVMGGGDGVGPVEEIARALDAALAGSNGPLGQIVVICGRNEPLRARLAALPWQVPARVQGFTDAMPDWMHACDAIVTKAGPGTIAEALICGLPILLSGYIPGQEEGNVGWVVAHGAGAFDPHPEGIARTIAEWFGPQAALRAQMAETARRLGRPHATRAIVAAIAALLDG